MCTRKTVDAVRKGVIIRGEEIKVHAKKKRDADNSDKETPSKKRSAGTTPAAASNVALERVTAETTRAARKESRTSLWAATGAEATVAGRRATRYAPSTSRLDNHVRCLQYQKKQAAKTSIFELSRVKNCISRLFGDPPPRARYPNRVKNT